MGGRTRGVGPGRHERGWFGERRGRGRGRRTHRPRPAHRDRTADRRAARPRRGGRDGARRGLRELRPGTAGRRELARLGGRRRPPRARRGPPRPGPVPVAVAGQVGPRDPPHDRAGGAVGGVLAADRGRWLRDPVHRALPPGDLRLQRRCPALDVACDLLRVRCPRDRPLPALQPRPGPRLPGRPRRGVPVRAVTRAGAGQVVAAGAAALPHRGVVHGRSGRLDRRRRSPGRVPGGLRRRPHRAAGPDRGDRPAVLQPLPPGDLRPRGRPATVGPSGHRLRGPDDRRLPALPSRCRRVRALPVAGGPARRTSHVRRQPP